MRDALQHRLANYKLPKRVLFVADLPRNTMGKVQKNVLRETYRDLYVGTCLAATVRVIAEDLPRAQACTASRFIRSRRSRARPDRWW